ncbi:Transketolase, C-terminal section [hydrothermal vent metagenome]|uniref:Transketolase, C-terminal section n=1 Tax=hydrothermal vent metagenome TaxID=652676 RepID=A0A3B1BC33_9ZZZZ
MSKMETVTKIMEKADLRAAYGDTLALLGEEFEEIVVLDADLSSSTRTSRFAGKYPNRFFNMGVSEQDMISTSAGLAAAGKTPFVSTFAIFASGRAWEQVRQSICLSELNVKVVASHGGITVGEDGPTHQALEDLTLMRVLPNMTVIVPADANEVKAVLRKIAETKGPAYVRISRAKLPVVNDDDVSFEIGKGRVMRHGSDVAIIACGCMVAKGLEAAETLAVDGIHAAVINMPSIKPIDEELILQMASTTGAIVTAEEHSILGGLGSAVMEVTCENNPVPVVRVGMKSQFGKSGDPDALLDYYGMNTASIVEAAGKSMALKKESASS